MNSRALLSLREEVSALISFLFVEAMLKQHEKTSVLLIKLLYVTCLYKK